MSFLDIFSSLAPLAQVAAPVAGYLLQKDAVDTATQTQSDAADKSLALTERIYNQNRQDMMPFQQTGVAANRRLNQLMGIQDFDEEAIANELRSKYGALFQGFDQPGVATAPGAPSSVQSYGQPQVLPGWNEAAQTYQTPFGTFIRGEAGKKAAEEAFMKGRAETLMREQYGDTGMTAQGGKQYNTSVTMPIGGIASRGDSYDNPYTGKTYNRAEAMDAIKRGDLATFSDQGATASYDPRPGFLDRVAPLIAGGILAAPAGLAAAGFGGAALPASHGVGQAIGAGVKGFSAVGNQLASRLGRV